MSISRRQFIQGSLAAGMAGAAGVLGAGSAMAARHDPLNEAQADFFKKFDRNVVLLPSKYGGYVQALDLAGCLDERRHVAPQRHVVLGLEVIDQLADKHGADSRSQLVAAALSVYLS